MNPRLNLDAQFDREVYEEQPMFQAFAQMRSSQKKFQKTELIFGVIRRLIFEVMFGDV